MSVPRGMSRMALSLIVVAYSTLYSLTALSDETSELEPLGTIHLQILNGDDGAPMPDVSVRVLDVPMGTTDERGTLKMELLDGVYHFTLDIEEGVYREIGLRAFSNRVVQAVATVHSNSDEVDVAVDYGFEKETLASSESESVVMSSIKGSLIDVGTKTGIANARIYVSGLGTESSTDENGRFEVAVPVGIHEIIAVHPEYETATLAGIEVSADASAEILVEAYEAGVEFEVFTVTAPRIRGSTAEVLEERKESSQVSDVIGGEQMSKSGDSSAASALRRVTGVTIVGGKYVYVRGLGERYSATRLNGLNLPSPDPERRVVPLDMFPTTILEGMSIQKTFSPDMPGEFGGGVVDLRTKGYPDDLTLTLGLSTGITAGSTFTTTPFSADRGPTDFLGIDGGHRALPEAVKEATEDASLETGDRFHPGYTREELSELSRAMPKNWGIERRWIPPDFKIAATGGNAFEIKKTRLGFLASVLYENEWDRTDKIVRDYKIGNAETNELQVNNRYKFFDTTNTVSLGGILALGVDFSEGQKIEANTVFDRITDNTFWRYQGFSFDSDTNIKVPNYEWVERMIFTEQVLGSHLLSKRLGLKLDWRYGYSSADRNEPDKRYFRYDYRADGDFWLASSHANGNRRDYLHVEDNAHDMGIELTFPFSQWTDETALLKAGGSALIKNRVVDIRRFKYTDIDGLPSEAREAKLEDFLVDSNMTVDGMVLQESTQSTDNYTGDHDVFAGFLMAELPLGRGFKATGGVRLEQSAQQVKTFSLFDEGDTVREGIDKLDLLPAVVLIYEFEPDMLVRLGYGKTVNRPDFSEMSPGCAPSYAGGYSNCGAWRSEDFDNKLRRAQIHNVDLRWEWYPSQGESLSFGGFFKHFIDPLESVVKAGTDKVKFIMNSKSARNLGLELDFRKRMGFITEKLDDLYVAGNATWVYSRVEIPDLSTVVQTNKKRALQGQSPYILNLQLGYDNEDIGTSVALLYNVFGRRISDVGSYGLPDVYEQPFHQLDFVVKQKIKSHFEIGFKAQNLIDGYVTFLQGEEIRQRYRNGRYFGLSAGYSY